MTRVVLFGASGQVGRAIRSLLGESHELVAPDSRRVDFRNSGEAARFVLETSPRVVINAAAAPSLDEARLSDRERTMVRLWIEAGATYPGTYAALGSPPTTSSMGRGTGPTIPRRQPFL